MSHKVDIRFDDISTFALRNPGQGGGPREVDNVEEEKARKFDVEDGAT